MAKNSTDKKNMKKKVASDYRKTMSARQTYAIENARLRASEGVDSPLKDKKAAKYNHVTDQLVGGKIEGSEVDANFAADIQKMKFCRKPVGFVMWLLYIVLLVALVAPFVLPKLGLSIGVDQYVALCMETEPKAETATDNQNEGEADENEGEDEEDAENASVSSYKVLGADEDEDAAEQEEEEESEEGEETTASSFEGTLYNLDDPVFGWIKFVAGKLNVSLSLGESPWYDAQVAKTEAGMTDSLASILILAYPPFIAVYVLLTLALMIQTLICFASGDRRIFRFTGIQNILLVICGAVIMIGCFASATEIDASMDFGGIVNFLIGGVTGAGGFTAGYGLLAILGLPVIEFILSFFLLEKKLRGREITQPIVVYHYKEK